MSRYDDLVKAGKNKILVSHHLKFKNPSGRQVLFFFFFFAHRVQIFSSISIDFQAKNVGIPTHLNCRVFFFFSSSKIAGSDHFFMASKIGPPMTRAKLFFFPGLMHGIWRTKFHVRWPLTHKRLLVLSSTIELWPLLHFFLWKHLNLETIQDWKLFLIFFSIRNKHCSNE